ncbi:Small subunit processome component 20-like [Acipenser ruthenus]|uniref:Small subunit processome component 20-like n=1 Tax=Acipenser ruthenus TaxID=7906 RepID=A0A444UNH9_ACIRT|nr:Small subunit processome component 20-like [Acipenser ruthenus]
MDHDLILPFAEKIFSMNRFEQLFLPSLLQYLEQILGMGDPIAQQLALEILTKLILDKAEPPTNGSIAFEKYPLIFTGQSLRSHAKEMDNKDFWKVFYEHLDRVAISTGTGLLTEKELLDELEDVQTSVLDQDHDKVQSGDVDVLYLEQLQSATEIDERTDFTNFRFLLWKAMALFPDRVEPRSRELSPLLLMFIKQLIAHLSIFSKFSNPRSLCLEPKLKELYTQVLLHQNYGLFFVPLMLTMTNDDSPKCKKLAALAAKTLLCKVNKEHQDAMFALVNTWLNG